MAKNLPAVSKSRGIQVSHTRRVMTRRGPKDIVVNPKVRKQQPKKRILKQRTRPPVNQEVQEKKLSIFPVNELKPKVREIRTPDQLWEKMFESDDTLWAVESINQNIEEAKLLIFDLFKEYDSFDDFVVAINEEGALEDQFMNWSGGKDGILLRTFGDFEGIEDETIMDTFRDPTQGKILTLEDRVINKADGWTFFRLNDLEDAETLMEFKGSLGDEDLNKDSQFMQTMYKEKIPFIHVDRLMSYSVDIGNNVAVKKKDAKRAKKFFRGTRNDIWD